MRTLFIIVFGLAIGINSYAQSPQIWVDYQADKANDVTPELLDYSYAGYHYSEEEIPVVDDWQQFNVTDYGAVADDEGHDDDAIQAAINAAEAHNGSAVVYFPAGKFLVSADNDANKNIRISRSNIVLKGAGSGDGGTEIFMDEMRVKNGHWQFLFEPASSPAAGHTFIAEPVEKGAFSVIVEDASGFSVGEVILITHKSNEFAEVHFEGLELNEDDWTRLFGSGGGMSLHELHEIVAINGTRLTFKNPIQTPLPELSLKYTISHYNVIEEVGVEDILFSSNWKNYAEDFVHHKDDIHDYAWNAIQFENVHNAWLRNCEFNSWNQVVDVRESIGVTIENIVISGKKGHASFLTRRGYGLLVKDCDDQAGQHHGPGTGYAGVNTIYLRCKMLEDQSIDSHSGQPYATLMDDMDGGVMNKNGGPYESYPHHGRDFTFWNFVHKSSETRTYDFWDAVNRNGNTYALPNFIGFQPNGTVNKFDVGIDQMEGERVSPASLFEAQLNLRLEVFTTKPTISWQSPNHGAQYDIASDVPVLIEASDPDGTVSKAILYINDTKQRELTTAPYQWGNSEAEDPDLFDLEGGEYWLKVEVQDNESNVTKDSILIHVGQAPQVEFSSPTSGDIHQSGTALTVEAMASDEDGTVAAVTLFLDDEEISELNTTPFRWVSLDALDHLTSGNYTLRLEATDNDGLITAEEQPLVVNDFPMITFDTPSTGQNFTIGSDVNVVVNASDTDGQIEEVRLYLNDDVQRKETVFPYAWGERSDLDPDLFDMEAGTYVLKAVAIDDLGSEATVSITVMVEELLVTGFEPNQTLSIYPNPVIEELIIRGASQFQNIEITDLMGRSIGPVSYKCSEGECRVNSALLNPGVYTLQIQTTTGKAIRKFFKN
ncbi:MAG: DUF4955 domain-containing protein [Reichenbachiella sp.]|uniref:DUF4955 domain-containing protein n=1 Tax=Reichenbachiella sp. TaxID=2184521 RepID=UPI003297FB49